MADLDYILKKFTRLNLMEFLDSDEYRKSVIWPISEHRALSHVNNPRISDDDVILTMAVNSEGQIIGYRTVMADWILNDGKKVKVGWISGTWVDPEYRRKGLATVLFDEIFKDWNGRLMYTNYAPISKKVYDKTGAFEEYASHMGARFHMKSNLTEILPSRFPVFRLFRRLLPSADSFFNYYILPFLTEPGMKTRLSYNFMIKKRLTDEEQELLFQNDLSGRSGVELNWVLDFPWVKNIEDLDKEVLDKYYFSAAADIFKQYFIVVYRRGKLVCIVMFTLKNSQMKVPYYYTADLDLALIADLIFTESWKNGVSHIDIYDEELTKEMKLKTAYFAFSKARERKYMVSGKLIEEFPDVNSIKISDGEGDVVFV